MRVNDQQVTFNVLEAMKNPDKVEDCNFINVVDFVVSERIYSCYSKEEIKAATFKELEEKDVAATHTTWLGEKQTMRYDRHFESLNLSEREVKPIVTSIESLHILELKLLPSRLKYVYLGKHNTLLVIISSSLNTDHEMSLVDVLRKYKKQLDGLWQISRESAHPYAYTRFCWIIVTAIQ